MVVTHLARTLSLLQSAADAKVVTPASNIWLDVLRSPAVILASIAVLTRWVIAPAVSAYNRRDLAPEIERIGNVSESQALLEGRMGQVEHAVAALECVPESLARIEEQLKTLFRRRSTDT